MDTKQFENKRWSGFDSSIGFRHKAALEMVLSGSVLDLGAGDGVFLEMLGESFEDKIGLDISEEASKKAHTKNLKVEVFDFASAPLPFDDGRFDTVVMLDVLEHLYSPQNLMAESVRVSQKHIIISVPNFNALPARIQMLFGKIPENNTPRKGHLFWFNLGILKKMIKYNGLKIVGMKTNTFWQNTFFIGRVTKFLSVKLPSIFALSFVVKAEK